MLASTVTWDLVSWALPTTCTFLNSRLGQSRCDDLESLGYLFLYFLRGSLPWQGLEAASQEQKEELILEKKRSVSTEDLCGALPKEFAAYFSHIRSPDIEDKPNYSYLRKNFRHCFVREGFEYDHVYDWTIIKFNAMMLEEQSQRLEATKAKSAAKRQQKIKEGQRAGSRRRSARRAGGTTQAPKG